MMCAAEHKYIKLYFANSLIQQVFIKYLHLLLGLGGSGKYMHGLDKFM